ncbi:hypothetical protein D3C72_2130980 [compost metagenome]
MRLIFRSESPMEMPNLPMRLSRPSVRPDSVIVDGPLPLLTSTTSSFITPCPVTACVSRSNVPLICMPLKFTREPFCFTRTGAMAAVVVALPP